MEYEFYAEENGLGRQLRQTKWVDGEPVHIDVFPNSFADCIMFEDGELLQEKLDLGLLSGTFKIVKTYNSVAEMHADFEGTDVGLSDLVIITSDVNDEDNSKLYVKTSEGYKFLTDMSGSRGVQGPQGIQGLKGDKGDIGITPSITHLEEQVAESMIQVNASLVNVDNALKKVDEVTTSFTPNAQDIADIIDMIGGI